MATNDCRLWLNEVNWDMIHEDAVTMYLEWGNNNFKDAIRAPVTRSDEYSVYFVVDTWSGEPVVELLKMNNYGSETLCKKAVPEDMGKRFMEEIGHLKGMHQLNEELRVWLEKEMDVH